MWLSSDRYIKMTYSNLWSSIELIIAIQHAINTFNFFGIAPPENWHSLVLEALKDSFLMWAERSERLVEEKNCHSCWASSWYKARADLKSSNECQISLYKKDIGDTSISELENHEKITSRPYPIVCKICRDLWAWHKKGKCLEDPKNRELLGRERKFKRSGKNLRSMKTTAIRVNKISMSSQMIKMLLGLVGSPVPTWKD